MHDADPDTYAWVHLDDVRRSDRRIARFIILAVVFTLGALVLL